MKIFSDTVSVSSQGFTDILDITGLVQQTVTRSGVTEGSVLVFLPGSTGAITTIEFESGAISDLRNALERLAPMDIQYEHDKRWGDGNGFSHVRSALMKTSFQIPVYKGSLALGTWQQVIFIDFDNRPRKREMVVQVTGN